MKLLPLLFFVCVFLSQASCKVASIKPGKVDAAQNVTSDFILNVKVIGGVENFSRLMNVLTAVSPHSDLQVHNYNSWPIPSQEINIRYNAITNTIMDKIQRDVLKCDGISGVSIARL